MAEALGVIASAVQIADTSIKLRKLWMGIKEMPDTVRDMIEDIDLLANTLAQIQNVPVLSSAAQQNTMAWKECCRTLQKVNASFQTFVSDLDKHMTVHKKSGSVKAFLKREKLIEWQDRLSRLKMTMLMAQQAYTQALFAQQCSTIIDTLQIIRTPQPAVLPTPQSVTNTRQTLDDGQVYTSAYLSVAKVTGSTSTRRLRKQAKRKVDIRLPNWLLQRGLQILIDRSHGSWTLNLKVCNIVPVDSEVFRAAYRRDWTKVQSLFDERRASPFDLCSNGHSLMHAAAKNVDVYGCRFLLDHGLEPLSQINSLFSPVEYLGLCHFGLESDPENLVQVVRSLAWSFEDHAANCKKGFFGFYALPIEAIRYLTTADSSDYIMVEPLRRARSLAAFRGADPQSISLILGPDLSLSTAFTLLYDDLPGQYNISHRTMIGALTRSLMLVMSDNDAVQMLSNKWCHTVTEIISFERQADKPLFFQSYIQLFIRQCCERRQIFLRKHEHGSIWSQKLTSAVRVWIKLLHAMGVDLDNYASAERHHLMTSHDTGFMMWKSRFAIRLNGLTCGPNIDDWSLYAVMADAPYSQLCGEEYEMAGSFWAWIENPELFFIPGSYPVQSDEPIDWEPCMIKGPIF